jgi:hypothetical protein
MITLKALPALLFKYVENKKIPSKSDILTNSVYKLRLITGKTYIS